MHSTAPYLTESDTAPVEHPVEMTAPARQAFRILQFGYTVAPIVAGLDKFLHRLTDWDKYLSPTALSVLGGRGHELMYVVGVIEILAGIGVALKPRIFANVVAVWLLGICVNLILAGGYLDIALRDFGLALGALALGRLSVAAERAGGFSKP